MGEFFTNGPPNPLKTFKRIERLRLSILRFLLENAPISIMGLRTIVW